MHGAGVELAGSHSRQRAHGIAQVEEKDGGVDRGVGGRLYSVEDHREMW